MKLKTTERVIINLKKNYIPTLSKIYKRKKL
jgi:hypothetical protein